MEIVGDFSLINPYGARVKGFPSGCLGLRVAQSSEFRAEGVLRQWIRVEGYIT